MSNLSQAEAACCGKVYLGGNVEYAGLQIQQFAEGGCAPDEHGPGLMKNLDDAKSWGQLLGALHTHDTAWFEEGGYQKDALPFDVGTGIPTVDKKPWPKLLETLKLCEEKGKTAEFGAQLVSEGGCCQQYRRSCCYFCCR